MNNQSIKEKIKREIKKYFEKKRKEKQLSKTYELQQKQFKPKVYNDKHIDQENRKASNKQLNFTCKELAKEEQTKSKVSRKKEIIKYTKNGEQENSRKD